MKLVCYFSDAFAWQYVQESEFMPGWWDERRPLRTILGYSSTILPCLISGKLPAETGIWTEYYREDRPQGRIARAIVASRVLLTPANLVRLVLFRVARKRGMPAAHKLRIPLQFSHHFARHDMDYRRFPPVELPVATIDQLCAERGLGFSFRYLTEEFDVAAELARFDTELARNEVFFFYDPNIDAHGHHAGADVATLRPDMDRVEQFLAGVWSRIGGEPEAHVLLFSDHGMTNVERTFDLFAALRHLRIGRDYLVFVDSTFARFWYTSEAVRTAVHEALREAPAEFLTAEEERRYGIDFADSRYGEEVLVVDEHVVFHPSYISPSGLRTRNYPDRATHGYRPESPTAYGICFRRGPGANPANREPVPAEGIFGIVQQILDRQRAPRAAAAAPEAAP